MKITKVEVFQNHFEQPSRDLQVCAEFTKRMDLPVSLHISVELDEEKLKALTVSSA